MKNISSLLFLLAMVGLSSMSSCKKEDTTPTDTCPTTNMSYQSDVKPILDASCVGCQNVAAPQGGVTYDTYTGSMISALQGSLVGSIKHASGFSAMPKNADKLDDCSIAKIEAWVTQGALNN